MLKICLVFWKSEPQYAYKLHAYKKLTCILSNVPQVTLKQLYPSYTFRKNQVKLLKKVIKWSN